MTNSELKGLAKITWTDPNSGEEKSYVLSEGATITIGRSLGNEICIREQHVSRQHAVISYQYGLFMISDLGSANRTYVNDEEIHEPYPLASGDIIRLYVPVLQFSGIVTAADEEHARKTGTFFLAPDAHSRPKLIITSGPQEGTEFPLLTEEVELGRAVANATWDIGIQDKAVSRPHLKIFKMDGQWYMSDLGSQNGTLLNNVDTRETTPINDGDVIVIGQTTILFRLSQQ